MKIERKLKALRQVLALYDELAGALETACRPGCSRCCTDRVTLTTLEACALSACSTIRYVPLLTDFPATSEPFQSIL